MPLCRQLLLVEGARHLPQEERGGLLLSQQIVPHHQEQGRPQLGLDFGTAKKSICTGFTVDQFSRLDLSRMDFSEVMADFVNAAKLPDDLQTATTMQAKIQAYYSSH